MTVGVQQRGCWPGESREPQGVLGVQHGLLAAFVLVGLYCSPSVESGSGPTSGCTRRAVLLVWGFPRRAAGCLRRRTTRWEQRQRSDVGLCCSPLFGLSLTPISILLALAKLHVRSTLVLHWCYIRET